MFLQKPQEMLVDKRAFVTSVLRESLLWLEKALKEAHAKPSDFHDKETVGQFMWFAKTSEFKTTNALIDDWDARGGVRYDQDDHDWVWYWEHEHSL